MIERDDLKKSNIIFVHSKIDDLGLTPYEFRIYAHIARRAGDGDCFPSIEGIASHCKCNHDTAREVIANLIAYGLISRTERPGLSPLYRLTHHSEWKTELIGTIKPKRTVRHLKNKETPPAIGEGLLPLRQCHTPPAIGEGYPPGNRVGDPSGNRVEEVHPLKGIQSKGIQDTHSGSFHSRFIEGWHERFEKNFGRKYLFLGGKDGAAVKALSSVGMQAEDMLDIAEEAWNAEDPFFSSISRTVAGFRSRFNELQTLSKKVSKKVPCAANDWRV